MLAVVGLLLQGMVVAAHTAQRLPTALAEAQAAGLPIAICTGGRTSSVKVDHDGQPIDAPEQDGTSQRCPLCTLVQLAVLPEPATSRPLERLAAALSIAKSTSAPPQIVPARIHGNRGPPVWPIA